MSETTTRTLPQWIRIYAIGVIIILSLVLAFVLIISPETLPLQLAGSYEYDGPIGLLGTHVAKYFATAVATAYALYHRSLSMMLLLFVIRLATDLPDLLLSGSYGYFPPHLIMFLLFVYWVPSVLGIHSLWHAKG